MPELSGPAWVDRFPTSKSVDDLLDPFRAHVNNFIAAMTKSKVTVSIAATLRPPQRAYLMHYAWSIAKGLDPTGVPQMAGVNIDWVHRTGAGQVDLNSSRVAAQQMIDAYDIVSAPALDSNHTRGLAIDMTISWGGDLSIINGKEQNVVISSQPRSCGGR